MYANTQTLIEKIQSLPADRIVGVEDFVDFIRLREQERALIRSAAAASGPTFAAIRANPEDDVYDALWLKLGALAQIDQGALRTAIAETIG